MSDSILTMNPSTDGNNSQSSRRQQAFIKKPLENGRTNKLGIMSCNNDWDGACFVLKYNSSSSISTRICHRPSGSPRLSPHPGPLLWTSWHSARLIPSALGRKKEILAAEDRAEPMIRDEGTEISALFSVIIVHTKAHQRQAPAPASPPSLASLRGICTPQSKRIHPQSSNPPPPFHTKLG